MKETKLTPRDMFTLSRNSLVNQELMQTIICNIHGLNSSYSVLKDLESRERLKLWFAILFICGSCILMILTIMRFTFESGWVHATMALTIVSGCMHLVTCIHVPTVVQRLIELHRNGFYGFYKLHWEFPRMQQEAARILETAVVRLKTSEDTYDLEHPQTKKIRTQLRKAHEIFTSCGLVTERLGHYFDTVRSGTLASKIERAHQANAESTTAGS